MSLKASARIKQKRQSSGPWTTSNNKVLPVQQPTTVKKSPTYGRNPNFDTDETKLLIQLWGDPKVQRTLITTHKKHAVICQLAAKMQEYGYYRSAEEITTRIKNLKCFYNRLKKDLESGQAIEPSWKHFAEMDAIMTRPIFSVRPNEVPAPSLKYQIEKAREENEKRKNKQKEEKSLDSNQNPNDHNREDEEFPGVSDCESEACSDVFSDGQQTYKRLEINCDFEMENDLNKDEISSEHNSSPEKEKELSPLRKLRLIKTSDLKTFKELDSLLGKEDNDGGEKPFPKPMIETELVIKEEEDQEEKEISSNKENSKEEEFLKENEASKSENNNKEEENSGNLIIPKEEPIDLDDDSNQEQRQNNSPNSNPKILMPTLLDILQLPKASSVSCSSSASSLITTLANSIITSSSSQTFTPIVSVAPPSSITTAKIATTSTTSSLLTNPPSKISLVPTNFLMQPKTTTGPTNTIGPQQILLQNQPINVAQINNPPRLVLNGDSLQQCGGNTGIVATAPGGMKVLLVNAEQAAGIRGGIQVQTSASNLLQPMQTMTQATTHGHNNLKQQQQQQQQIIQHQHQQQQQQQQQKQQQAQRKFPQPIMALQGGGGGTIHSRENEKRETLRSRRSAREERERSRREELMTKKEITGMRILLRQLINAQHEHNEIEHQRLALEKERLEFEKKAVDRLTDSVPLLLQQMQQQFFNHEQQQQQQQQQFLLQQQQQMQQQLQQQQLLQQQVKQTNILTSTGGQLRFANPPKLLFTVPQGGQTITNYAGKSCQPTTILASSNSLTTSLPKVTTTIPLSNLTGSAIGGLGAGLVSGPKPIEICTQINDYQLIQPKIETVDD